MKHTNTETKTLVKPFGLEFLEEMSEQELRQYSGGRHHHKPPLHTMGLSGPTAGHPNGDYHG